MHLKQQRNLHVWGKNFPNPTLLKRKVVCAAAGENHILFSTSQQNYGYGSNKFGQLGLKEHIFFNEPVKNFDKWKIISHHCGAEHSFFITDKYEVYSVGLNIKGQLGHSYFQNTSTPKIVLQLIPFGSKNPKASSHIDNGKQSKAPLINLLQKYDLQVKIEDLNDTSLLLYPDEHISDISCGALFSIALSSKGRIFGSGLQGISSINNHEEQLEKSRFRLIDITQRIERISCGLSGSAATTVSGKVYVWGRFGRHNINVPKQLKDQNQNTFVEAKVGDQYALLLTSEGQVYSWGQNIQNQLGFESHEVPFIDSPIYVDKVPISLHIFVGRNSSFSIDAENNKLFGWGSNRYGQISTTDSSKCSIGVTYSGLTLAQNSTLISSSYFTLLLTKVNTLQFPKQKVNSSIKPQQEKKINISQYNKLLHDYQILKSLNLTLLEKCQPKESKQTQTTSKFEIQGVTQHRKFSSNTQILWKQLQIESQINQGGYGVIFKAKWREISVVVKKFKIENGDVSLRDFLSECHAMQAVRHPSIVMFLGAVVTSPNYSIILEYCSRGSLWSYIQNKQNVVSWEERRRFAIEIAQGVLYLHSCSPPILHRDLKSLNIFLDSNLRIKIGDFGWTKTLEEYMTNKIGTYQWMAPEVIGNKPYTQKADIFSFAIIMWEIASRQPPYRNISGSKVSEDVLHKELRPSFPSKCPESYAKLMKKCWDSDPVKRPNFKEIVKQLEVMKLS